MYKLGAQYHGSYSKYIPTEAHYWSDSIYDDLAWGACWIYKVTGGWHLELRAQGRAHCPPCNQETLQQVSIQQSC